MATPTPAFPVKVATDADLKVANNQITTTLSVPMDAGNTIIFVNSATGFRANSLISIDKEIIAIASVSTSPNPQLTVATGGRGFDGTLAAAHSPGAKISMLIDAWHHNALAAEVKAIETFIGPQGQNLAGIAGALNTSGYNFAAQTPGGPLVPGNNVITLSPVPIGVNGSDQHHYLYISGGSGSAEAVLITGGTAVSGAASGTVIVNCANAHSGPWTIGTATSGIQEAIVTAGARGSIYIPAGSWPVYATITKLANTEVSIFGAGISSTALAFQFGAGDGVFYDATGQQLASFGNLRFDSAVPRTSGYDLHVKAATFGTIENLYSRNTLNGFQFENCNSLQVRDLQVQNFSGNGFFLNATSGGSGGFYCNLDAVGNGVNGILVQAAPGAAFSGTVMTNINIQDCTNNWDFNPNGGTLNEFCISNVILDTWSTRGMYFGAGPGTGNGISLVGVRAGTSSGAGFAIGIESNWSNFEISNFTGGASGEGIVLRGASNIGIHNTHVAGDGGGSGGNVALYIQDSSGIGVQSIQITDSTFGFSESGLTTGGTSTTGILISGAPHNRIRLDNVAAFGNGSAGSGALYYSTLGIGCAFMNCNFVGHLPPSVASAATMTFPPEDFFMLTGNVAVTAVTGLTQGQRGSFVATAASPGTWTAGASIGNTLTPTQNVPVTWIFDGTQIWLK